MMMVDLAVHEASVLQLGGGLPSFTQEAYRNGVTTVAQIQVVDPTVGPR